MKLSHLPAVAAFVITGLVVVGIVVLAALHVDIPSILETIGLVAVGGGAGASIPVTPPAALPSRTSSLAPAPAPVAAAQ